MGVACNARLAKAAAKFRLPGAIAYNLKRCLNITLTS